MIGKNKEAGSINENSIIIEKKNCNIDNEKIRKEFQDEK